MDGAVDDSVTRAGVGHVKLPPMILRELADLRTKICDFPLQKLADLRLFGNNSSPKLADLGQCLKPEISARAEKHPGRHHAFEFCSLPRRRNVTSDTTHSSPSIHYTNCKVRHKKSDGRR